MGSTAFTTGLTAGFSLLNLENLALDLGSGFLVFSGGG
jgi:hypothetical protein